MAWGRIDDKRALNRKLRDAGFAARGLDEAAICWANHEESDGIITEDDVEMLGAAHGCTGRPLRLLIARLVDVGRWEHVPGTRSYVIHDFLDFNTSRSQIEARRTARAEAGSRGGRISKRVSKC